MAEMNLQTPPQAIEALNGQPLKIPALSAEDIQDWLITQISGQLRVYSDEIDIRAPFSSYGLTSLQAMEISALGKDHLGLPLSPLVIWNFPNIETLSQFLAEELAASEMEVFEI